MTHPPYLHRAGWRPGVWFATSQEALDARILSRDETVNKQPATPAMNLVQVAYKDSIGDLSKTPPSALADSGLDEVEQARFWRMWTRAEPGRPEVTL